MMVRTERFRLRGVHFLYDPQHNEPKHGHEYLLCVSIKGDLPRDTIREVVQHTILGPWDKQNWNQMGVQQASGELLVEEFDRLLRSSPIGPAIVAISLKETHKNRFVSSKSLLSLYDE